MTAAAAMAQDKTAAAKKVNPTPPPAAAKTPKLTIPAGAVETAPYTYAYTDPQGRKWIYHKTPFGVSRVEDRAVATTDKQKADQDKARLIEMTRAADDGDSVRFERPTPFGPMKWSRKKTELNEIER